MAETKRKKNKKKKVTISEEDISSLLRRYSAATIIALLQEIAHFADAKIDWNELVQKTSTGITSAREYQMVWRHLAYRDTLLANVDGADLLNDDSDLESDLEAFPPVSGEASAEAAACAKVLLGSDLARDSGSLNRSIVEAPLTLNIPNYQTSVVDSDNPQPACTQGRNITVPVSIQRLSLPTLTSTEGLEGSPLAVGGLPARRKRKPWTEDEDMELIAAVQKCGERNWANIVKGDFKGDRTASQLSQRWAILRKRQAIMSSGVVGTPANSQLTEAQLATRRAVSHALNMPMMDNFNAACSVGATQPNIPSTCVPEDTSPGPRTTSKSKVVTAANVKKGASVTFKTLTGPPLPNPMVQAAAVAAGARIATPSTAASLLKAAQSKNVFHIRQAGGGGHIIKIPGGAAGKTLPTNHLPSHPNVHYIRTGLSQSSPAPSTAATIPPSGSSNQQVATCSLPLNAATTTTTTTSSTLRSQQVMSAYCSSVALRGADEGKAANAIDVEGLPSKEDVNSDEMMKVDGQVDHPKVEVLTEDETVAATGENKESESCNDDKKEACSTDAMDVD